MWRPLPAVAAAVCVGLLAATAAGVWWTRRDGGVQLRAGTTRQRRAVNGFLKWDFVATVSTRALMH